MSVSQITSISHTGIHLSNLILWIFPSLCTSTSNRSDNAFTTEAPTPCKPPDIL